MHPNIVLNYPAMIVSVIVAFFLGFLWYGPLFGKIWATGMGMKMDKKPDAAFMRRALGLQLLGICLVVFVLSHSIPVWRASVWGIGTDQPDYVYGFFGGFFTWIGFYVPLQLNKIAWEGRPWTVFFINAGHDFVNLQLISQILSHWH